MWKETTQCSAEISTMDKNTCEELKLNKKIYKNISFDHEGCRMHYKTEEAMLYACNVTLLSPIKDKHYHINKIVVRL